MSNEVAIKKLKEHARVFLDSGLWAYTGYFPNDSYGEEGAAYYRWSKKAFDLIKNLEDEK